MRDLTSGMVTQISADNITPILLTKLENPEGDLFLWNGFRDIDWQGDTYIGAGGVGTISPIKETLDMEATGVEFTLNGLIDEHIALALSATYKNEFSHVWFGAFDEANAIVVDPVKLHKGRMDVMTIEEGGENSILRISSENLLVILKQASLRKWTDQDQKTDYPDDRGLEFVSDINDGKKVVWGT